MEIRQVIYIHARPQGHPTHKKYGDTVASDSIFYDYLVRWHDKECSTIRKVISWFGCALFFKNKRKYGVFYTDGITYFPVIMKKLGLINSSRQKLISLQGDEMLYFLRHKRYGRMATILQKYCLMNYDALICIGKQQEELAKVLLGNTGPKIYRIYNGIPKQRISVLVGKSPALCSEKMLFVANIQSVNRSYYKGLDLILDVFAKMILEHPNLELHLAGKIDSAILFPLLKERGVYNHPSIVYLGFVECIDDLYENYDLYIHLARGEAWGLSVAEAALSGLPVLISDQTGVKEVVSLNEHIAPLEIDVVIAKLKSYFNLTVEMRKERARLLRENFARLDEEAAIANFKRVFELASNT